MEEIACHEMVIHLSQRLSKMLCLFLRPEQRCGFLLDTKYVLKEEHVIVANQ